MLDFGTFDSPNYRTIIVVTLGIATVAVLIVIIVTLSGRPVPVSNDRAPATETLSIPTRDFALPNETPRRFYALVPSGEPWTDADMAPYWTDPAEIGGELLEEESRRLIQSLFDSVP